MFNRDDQPTTPAAPPREMTPDLPPAPGTRRCHRNRGRFDAVSKLGPTEFFAVGVSGRVRRNPTG
ncbi:hypothetical protein ACIBF5_11645 [Micromonospora sp. NPDC050417]|uniref:hypothetical protein n=1 Tax=Micromonospora sp. NPDC050417 TaxID=3364280 RepID=UPI0037948FE6